MGWRDLRRAAGRLYLIYPFFLALAPAATRAQPPPRVELFWNAPSACPDQAQARRTLSQLVAAPSPSVELATVRVEVVQRDEAFAAEITFSGALAGQRTLTNAVCGSLADAALLIVAITVDPTAALQYMASERELTPTADDRVRPELGLALGADFGSLPNATFGAGLWAGLSRARFHAQLEAKWWLPREAAGPRTGTAGEVRLVDGTLRACFDLLRLSQFGLGPCGALALGWSSGAGQQLRDNDTAHALWAAALIGLHLRQDVARIFIDVGGDFGLSFVQPEYVVGDFEVFRPGFKFGRLSFGIGWSLR